MGSDASLRGLDHPREAERSPMKTTKSKNSQGRAVWVGRGSTKIPPPPEYWAALTEERPGPQIEKLKEQSDQRHTEFVAGDLPGLEEDGLALLKRWASDGWVEARQRHHCPECGGDLDAGESLAPTCPHCGKSDREHSGIISELVFVRDLGAVRNVDWVVAIHGMNTSGAWQEAFSWKFSTTWGRSVPVAVYKYGIVI